MSDIPLPIEPTQNVAWFDPVDPTPDHVWVEVFDVIAEDTPFDFGYYRRDEEQHLTPALIRAGYKPRGPWRDGEADSFGPLTRWIPVEKDGNFFRAIYG